ncbi:MAG: hypothetical protein ACRDCE_15100, partial [Cetobacterium sp.]|uniref:hypothetical protein n=1 Tax=Cetobacterium sp. TaxID=2071632 RepID=UPI003EE7731C
MYEQYPDLYKLLNDPTAQEGAMDMASVPPLYNAPQPQGQPGVDEDAWVYKTEDASIMNTLGAKWDTAFEALMASNAGQEHSQFAAANLKRKAAEARAEQEKLGVMGNMAVGAANLVPIIGTSILATPAAGAGVAGLIYTGETAAQQAMEGQDVNWGSAALAGGATAAADLLTGGVAGRFKAALPATAPLAKHIGINATEDAVSAIAGNSFVNMATGKQWDEGIVEAGLMGAGAGGAVRGSLYGFSKVRNTPVNKFGEQTINDITNLKSKAPVTPTDDFVKESYAYNNEAAKMYDDAANTADTTVRDQNIDAAVNMAAQGGGRAASVDAMKLAEEYGIPFLPTAFDVDVANGLSRDSGSYKLYEEMGIPYKEIQKSGEAFLAAQPTYFGRTKTAKEGLSKEAYEADFQDKFKQAMGKIKGTFSTNVTTLKDIAWLARHGEDADPAYASRVDVLASDASTLQKLMQEYTGNEKTDVGKDIEIVSKRLVKGLMQDGLMGKMVGLDGKPGTFDPPKNILTVDHLERMSKSNMPNVHQGTPNKFRNTLLNTDGSKGFGADALTFAVGGFPAAIARRMVAGGVDELYRHGAQRNLRKFKESGAAHLAGVDRALAARKAQAMAEGDMDTAAKVAEEQLRQGEVDVGPVPPSPFEVDAAQQAQAAAQAQAQAAASRTAPVPARDPRQQLTPEEQAVVQQVAESDPVAAEQLVEQIIAQKSAPVPAAEPVRRAPTPGPEPAPNPAMMSRSMAAQPEMTPEAQRAQIAAKLQEEIQAQQVAQQADTVPEAAPAPTPAPEAPVRSSPVSARQPKQPQAPEPEVAPKASEEAPSRADSKELVRAPLIKDKEQYANMSSKDKDKMLDTDPARLKQLRDAEKELTETNTLLSEKSSKHNISPEVTAVYLDSMGGVRGIKQAIKDEDINSTVGAYFDREVKRMEREKSQAAKAKIAEIRNQPKPKPVKVEPTPEEKARVIADKHIGTREELDSLGYDKDIIEDALKKSKATDTTADFDPKIVKNWARTLSKQKLAKAKQDALDADEALKAAAPKLTIADSTKELNDYLKGVDAGDVPGVRELIDSATKHLKSPLTETKMASIKSRIDDAIKREEQALSDALNSKNRKALDPVEQNKYMAKHAKYKSYVDQIAKNKAKIDADKAAKEAELKKAQE